MQLKVAFKDRKSAGNIKVRDLRWSAGQMMRAW